jgi:hypothetical protein
MLELSTMTTSKRTSILWHRRSGPYQEVTPITHAEHKGTNRLATYIVECHPCKWSSVQCNVALPTKAKAIQFWIDHCHDFEVTYPTDLANAIMNLRSEGLLDSDFCKIS